MEEQRKGPGVDVDVGLRFKRSVVGGTINTMAERLSGVVGCTREIVCAGYYTASSRFESR
jgi:hypothetical protein